MYFSKNTSNILIFLSNETRVFIDLCVEPLLSFASEMIIFIFILIFLILIEPEGTFLVITTLLVTIIFIFYQEREVVPGVKKDKHQKKR